MSKFKILQNDDIIVIFNTETGTQTVITDDFMQYFVVNDFECKTDVLKIQNSITA